VLTALAVNLLTVPALWPGQLAQGVHEISFARARYYAFEQEVERLRDGERAVVLVIPFAADRHMHYVTNHAGLEADVLRVRWDREALSVAEIQELFPGRKLLVFDAEGREFEIP
jgi:hypothetical protein